MATTDKERLEYVEDFHKSGLMPVAFCKKHKLNVKTFYVWLKRYPINDDKTRLRPALMVEPSFLPLQIKPNEVCEDILSKHTLTFKSKNFCLDVTLNFDESLGFLKVLLKELHALS
jgi:hypothetical protein